jgi:hypothetical protein
MQPESNKPKKPLTKNWKSQAQRTADSVKKLKKGVDLLTPWAQAHPGETIHRTEIPYRIYAMLQGVQGQSRNPKDTLHSIARAFFETAFEYDMGQHIILEDAWGKLMQSVEKADGNLVHQLNNEESRNIFFWQVAGHTETYPHSFRHKPISIVRVIRGPRKGKLVPCYEVNGEFIPLPNGGEPPFPFFRCLGSHWNGKPVFNHTVVNMSLSWPCQAFEDALKMLLWEPSKKTLDALERRRKRKRPPS